jgi:hypothetical protein|tara:strand:- start:181 stop:1371 length:1191 start_codon:yes stop_codon:yes gene_type:complete
VDFSKHSRNGMTTHYAYYEYELIDDAQREANKGELQCYGCNASTKFVKASKNGSQAYFGLMPGEVHEDKCDEIKKANEGSSLRRKREEKHYIEAVEKIQNSTGEIEIDSTSRALFEKLLDKDSKGAQSSKLSSKVKLAGDKGKSHVISSEKIRASRKNLIQLLKFCLYSSRFLRSTGLTLHYKDRTYLSNERVKQFFQVGSITNTKIPYFFYGAIRGVDESLTFIHVGAQKTQVVIDRSICKQLWNALEVDKYWQLLDAQMICFGWLKRSNKGKSYIVIKDISDIAIIDIKENSSFKPHETARSNVFVSAAEEEKLVMEDDLRDAINHIEERVSNNSVSVTVNEAQAHINESIIDHAERKYESNQAITHKPTEPQISTTKSRSWVLSLISIFRKAN